MARAAQLVPEQQRQAQGGLGGITLYYGLLAPPLAWCVQEYLGFGLASHACFPQSAPRASFLPGYGGVWATLLSVNLALLIVAALGLLSSGLVGNRLKQVGGPGADLLGPRESRIRVLAASGILVALLFAIAIAFNTISLATLFTCSQV
jgi:hypothetical protein